MEIYVRKDGQEYGPYTLDELRYHVLTGNCSANDSASHDGENWMTISQVPGLVSEYQPVEEGTQAWLATDQTAETKIPSQTEQPRSLPSAEDQAEGQQTLPVIARQLVFTSSPQGLDPGRSGY